MKKVLLSLICVILSVCAFSQENNDPWEQVRNLARQGMEGVIQTSESILELEANLSKLKGENEEQINLLQQAYDIISNLKKSIEEAQNNVEIAIDRMQDAESYAVWVEANDLLLKEEIARLKKSAPIGFAFGGVTFGISTPLIVEGIRTDNKTMMYSGIGTAAVGSGLWAAGHYLFHWW